MKKLTKIFSYILAMMLFVVGMVPAVSAQETDIATVLNEISAANKDIESAKGDLNAHVFFEMDGTPMIDLNISGPFMYNVDPRFSANTELSVTGTVANGTAEESGSEVQTEEISEQAVLTLVEGMLYVFDGKEWSTQDFTETEKEITDAYNEAKAQEESIDTAAVNEKMAKYYDLEETDDMYILRLKEGIDPQAFWTDMNEVLDIEAIKEEAIAQAQKQAEDQGVEFTDAQRDQIDYYFNNFLNLAVELFDQLEMHYSKDGYKLMKMIFAMSADETHIAKALGMDPEALGVKGNGQLTYEINFSNHGESFDIQKPADAPEQPTESMEMDESGDESSEANDESQEDSESEDASAVEETTVEETSAN